MIDKKHGAIRSAEAMGCNGRKEFQSEACNDERIGKGHEVPA